MRGATDAVPERIPTKHDGRKIERPSREFEDWDDYFKNSARFTDDFFEAMEELRNTHLPLEERESFD